MPAYTGDHEGDPPSDGGGDWFDQQPAPTPAPAPGPIDGFRKQLNLIYQRYFHRDATDGEVQAHQANPGGLTAVEALVKASAPAGWDKPAAGDGPQNGDYQGWITSLLAGKPFNQQALLDLEPTLKQYGVILQPGNAQNERTKVQLPNGQIVRLGFGEGHPVWVVQSGASGSNGPAPNPNPGTGPGSFSLPPDPYHSTPWTGGDYTPPPLPADLQQPFTPPTQAELEASPGYATRLAAGRQGRERAFAAQGTLANGGTMKALERYAQDYGSNEYNNFYGQRLSTRNQNYSEYQGAVGVGQQTYATRRNAWQDENARTRTDWQGNTDARRNWENDYWGRLRDLYRGGLDASL